MHRGTIVVRIIVVYSAGKFDTREHVTAILVSGFSIMHLRAAPAPVHRVLAMDDYRRRRCSRKGCKKASDATYVRTTMKYRVRVRGRADTLASWVHYGP